MRPTLVVDVRVVVRVLAMSGCGIGDADRHMSVRSRQAVGAGERPEVVIEGAVLLHEEDQMIEVHDPRGWIHVVHGAWWWLRPAEWSRARG